MTTKFWGATTLSSISAKMCQCQMQAALILLPQATMTTPTTLWAMMTGWLLVGMKHYNYAKLELFDDPNLLSLMRARKSSAILTAHLVNLMRLKNKSLLNNDNEVRNGNYSCWTW